MRVGINVTCATCGKQKIPWGRSCSPVAADAMCDPTCLGYAKEPKVGELWPGESERDFGYKVRSAGTREGASGNKLLETD